VGIVGPPIRVSPVFALNFDSPSADTLFALNGLVQAGKPGPPISPIFYGLANDTPPPTF